MAVIKTIEKGESLTFGFVLPETYNLANLQAVKIYIGSSIYEHKMDGRTVRVELESNQTALITGRNIVHFVIDDAVFGIKKINCGELEVLPTQATHKDESVNTGYDVEIVLSINVETVSIGSVLYDTLQGDKGDAGTIEVGTVTTGDAGTDVIVENVGTQSEAVLNFTIPRGSAGYTPYIGENGNWFINGVDTGVQADGDATQQWVTDNFVVKESGKSLISDTEITRLASVTNQTLEELGGETAANKQNSLAADGTGVKYPTVDAVRAGLSLKADSIDLVEAKQSISTLENVLSDANINQEARVTTSGVDTVSLPKTAANTGMQVQMFGQSAYNLVNGADIAAGASVTFATILNNKYYVSNQIALVTGDGNNYTSTNSGATTINIVAINLTATFGAGNEPTKEQCDLLFANYFEGSANVLGTGRVRSVNSSGLNPSYLYFNGGQLRSNGLTKDEIRKGTNGYELVKRVGVGTFGANGIAGGDFESGLIGNATFTNEIATWTLNTTSPISGTKDGRLVITTVGTNAARPILSFTISRTIGQLRKLSFSYKVNSGTVILSGYNNGGGYIALNNTLSGSGVYSLYYVYSGALATLPLYFDGRNLFDLQIDNLKDELVNTVDGTTTSASVTELDSNVHYTLSTPTTTPISHAGLLSSNSNGTAYFEPIIADAGVYSSNLAIQLTDYPIASFESIRKYVNGTYTELNPATAVIAGNGLSFTHPDLVSGDLVMFKYAYNRESIGRSMTLTHYDNRYVKVDTENGKTYRIDFVVTNGVVVPTATEV